MKPSSVNAGRWFAESLVTTLGLIMSSEDFGSVVTFVVWAFGFAVVFVCFVLWDSVPI